VNFVKFLSIFSFKPENVKAVRERFKTWTPPADLKFVLPVHTIIGANKTIGIIEAAKVEDLVKLTREWSDLGSFKIRPIMASAEAVKLV